MENARSRARLLTATLKDSYVERVREHPLGLRWSLDLCIRPSKMIQSHATQLQVLGNHIAFTFSVNLPSCPRYPKTSVDGSRPCF